MRLTPEQVASIRQAAFAAYGPHCRLWLFGSRTDDAAKGGDIDLYVEPDLADPAELVKAKLRFLADLHRRLGDRKIDVVVRRSGSGAELPIWRVARETGVRLS
jgi:predicted nucleotidyltransferase